MSSSRRKPPSFTIEMPGDNDKKIEIMEKLKKVRGELVTKWKKAVNNYDIIKYVLDEHFEKEEKEPEIERAPSTFVNATESQAKQPFFVSNEQSIMRLLRIASAHGHQCKGSLRMKKVTRRGHVVLMKFVCCSTTKAKHTYLWSSSPYMKDGKYLVNSRINHGYSRFCRGAGIGTLSVAARDEFFKAHRLSVKRAYQNSITDALHEEIGMYEDLSSGINIITDARHGWRKHAHDTSVDAI